ncbi:tRNA(Ile)-lysidine synthase [Weissella uvarum]|uniref:tRNA lysidine(34) synthetase TilS n=1 Tax=Weissella uvarum TaxID=1479233 RepID=UPI00195F72FD|nr:tRNA lysidine(34) synthetase TilS [Weissella uvarum]MBM7618067.1 tRNA(Ile)-lysidine synthase [Weissella uvarum]MCM0595076.1 tRNA lysidine(34) synthetase TilS [Weissella uvarum]
MPMNKRQRELIEYVRQVKLFDADDHLLVAFSGGHDSSILLAWLTNGQLPADLQPKVSVLYVNHQLRPDAAAEEASVRRSLDQTKNLWSSKIVRLDWEKTPTTRVEEQARHRRYAALIDEAKAIGANKLVTAHHQDDQAETILYKLVRGGNITQLKGMQASVKLNDGLALIRPFLGIPKASLDKLIDKPLSTWVTDSSNQNNQFARNRIRNAVMPELEQINQQTTKHLEEFADQLAGMEYLLEKQLPTYYQQLAEGTFDWKMPDAAIEIILQRWLNQQGCFSVKNSQIKQAIQMMRNPSISSGEIRLNQVDVLRRKGRYISLVKIG